MRSMTKFSKIAVAVALSVSISTAAMAQVTSSSMTGQVVGPQGNPAPGTVVTITHTPTGTKSIAEVNNSGAFNVTGLRVGGPYTINFKSNSFKDTTITDVYLNLGEVLPVNLSLESTSDVEVIAVTGSQVASMAFGNQSPSVSFSIADLQSSTSINRNINDVIRVDPRLYVDEGGNDGIQCAGRSPRFNSLTLDGVRQNDLFGLNSNGYPTERQPFPFDAIEGVTVEFAPFDVFYGDFTACNINAVTKSGTNEVAGSVFFDITGDSFRGDSLEGDDIAIGDFTEKRFGFEVGAPLIKDKLFIYAAYEKLEGVNLFDRGPIGSGAVDEVSVSQADLDEIAEISRTLYQYDPGPIPTSLDNEDEKLLVKLDWNINSDHRASLTYSYNDGNNLVGADRDSNEIEFLNHGYERGAEQIFYVASLYSDWNDNFSTELRLNYQEVDNRQNSLAGDGTVGGNDFGEIRVDTGDVDVYLGSDDSRQANDLDYDSLGLIFRGFYYFDNGHNVTFGYERNELDVFNLFVQHTETEIRFNNIENFRAGLADAIYYNNAISGNLEDAAANWGFTTNSLYAQDEFYLTDDLKVTAGLRYDWYTSNDAPNENPEFTASYGFSNSTNLDGEGLLQPRIGLLYTLSDSTELRGGVGLYSGGNPNVWLSNNFSNTNTTQVGVRGRSFCYTPRLDRAVIECNGVQRSLFDDDVAYVNVEDGVPAAAGYGIPSELDAAVRAGDGSNFEINYLDPDFEIPSEWKFSAGVTHVTQDDYIINADVIYSRFGNAAITLRGDLEEVGVTDEGYIDYDSQRLGAFVLTNADVTATALSLSTSVSKSWDNGIRVTAGYNYNDAEDVQPMNSAVAFSNYQNRAFTNPNDQVASTSDWNIEHRFTVDFRYTTEFFEGLQTRFSAFGLMQSGRPYSLTVDNSNAVFGFTPFLEDGNVLPIGGVRNDQESPNWAKIDIGLYQDLPAFTEGHSAQAFIVMNNFTNFLNDDWGILEQAVSNTVTIGDDSPVSRVGDASLWELRVGVRYTF